MCSKGIKVSETIWNCREINENNVQLKHALWRYLKRFGTVGKRWKHENKDAYTCNMTRFYTIFWLADKILKTMKLNGAFWRFLRLSLTTFRGSDSAIHHPHPFNFYCKFGRYILCLLSPPKIFLIFIYFWSLNLNMQWLKLTQLWITDSSPLHILYEKNSWKGW